ncbi:MAG: universal stress protein [Alphaproteobacteria bacterium]|nr:universal stress protein [Alphaproteobacteria bacterium]
MQVNAGGVRRRHPVTRDRGRRRGRGEGDMTIRTILAPVRGAEGAERAMDAALAVGRKFGAHVELLHVSGDPRDAIPFVGDAMISADVIDEIVRKVAEDTQARINRARARFDALVGDHAVRRIEARPTRAEAAAGTFSVAWRHLSGREDEVVSGRGRIFDLIVTDRPMADDDGLPEATLEGALLGTGRPIFVAPPGGVPSIGTRVAIAWNGSTAAARAVAAAMPFLEQAESTHILVGQSPTARQPLAEDLATMLAWHQVKASVKTFDPGSGHVGNALLAEAHRLHADLLVMGGYGHSHLREMIFGGATIDAIFAAELPLLMIH